MGYDTAQICRNGHIVNESAESEPERNQDYCEKCGEPTTTTCLSCSAPIRGDYNWEVPTAGMPLTKAPGFCQACGKPYPWTESKIEAARQLAEDFEIFDISDRAILEQSIDEILKDTPKAPAAAMKFKKLVEKAGPVAMKAFERLLYATVTQEIRELIWGK